MQRFRCIAVIFALSTISAQAAEKENKTTLGTPFDSYSQVADKIFVYDKSQFTAYAGPDVTSWNIVEPEIATRTRLGIVSLTPTVRVYVDVVRYPIDTDFEIRETKYGELIKKFTYSYALKGALLFNGRGSLYEYGPADRLCWGSKTNKYTYAAGKLEEVPQPLSYLSETDSKLLGDAEILFKPEAGSAKVASLTRGTVVKVLSVENSAEGSIWLLVKSPLGLTGWIQQGLDITNCN